MGSTPVSESGMLSMEARTTFQQEAHPAFFPLHALSLQPTMPTRAVAFASTYKQTNKKGGKEGIMG